MIEERDIEIVVHEMVEEVVTAGGCRFMRGCDLEEFVTSLVLQSFDDRLHCGLRPRVRAAVEMALLQHPSRVEVAVDEETVRKLRDACLGR